LHKRLPMSLRIPEIMGIFFMLLSSLEIRDPYWLATLSNNLSIDTSEESLGF